MAKITYKNSVARDLKLLDKTKAESLIQRFEESLSGNPNVGEPLKGEFKGLYKLRLGDYRIIYSKVDDEILVLRIGHRSKVY